MDRTGRLPTLGVLINDVESTYQKHVSAELCKQARAIGIRPIFYSGSVIGTPTWCERQMNLVYHLADVAHLDALLLVTSTFMRAGSEPIVHRLLAPFNGRPCVSLTVELEGVPSVLVDNVTGLSQALAHLIHDHGYREFAFLSGPTGSPDASQRLKVFRSVLEGAGIRVDPRLIQNGEFYYFGARQATERLFASGVPFRVIIAANDAMALAAMAVVTERGLRVPEDIAIVGVDDLHHHVPELGLSTVNNAIEQQVARSLYLLREQGLSGHYAAVQETVTSRFVRRSSCGCEVSKHFSHRPADDYDARCLRVLNGIGMADHLRERFARYVHVCTAALQSSHEDALTEVLWPIAMEYLEEYPDITPLQALIFGLQSVMLSPEHSSAQTIWQQSMQLNKAQMMLLKAEAMCHVARGDRLGLAAGSVNHVKRQLLSFEIHQQVDVLPEVLSQFGIQTCMIAFYEEQGHFNTSNDYFLPAKARLVACVYKGRSYPEYLWRSFDTRSLLPEDVWDMTNGVAMTVLPAFQQIGHYGYMVFGPELPVGVSLESVREAIASALIGALLVEEVGRVRDYLGKALLQRSRTVDSVEQARQHDPLSGLLNRQGFLNHARHCFSAKPNTSYLLVDAHILGMNVVLAQHEHKEVDVAIEGAARVFMNALRATDVLARIDAERFVALCADVSEDFSLELQARLAHAFDHFNRNSAKTYQLGLALAFKEIELPLDDNALEQLVDVCLVPAAS